MNVHPVKGTEKYNPNISRKLSIMSHRDEVLSPHGGKDDHAGVEAVVPLVRHPVPGLPEGKVYGGWDKNTLLHSIGRQTNSYLVRCRSCCC